MKKLYAFLLAMIALTVVSSGAVQAQTYAMTDYLLRTTTGSGDPSIGGSYQEITGTHISDMENQQYQNYYWISKGIPIPFNFRFLNNQMTTSDYFEINGSGSVIFSPYCSQHSNQNNYDFESYYCYSYCYDFTNRLGYSYPYWFEYGESDGAPYIYYTDFTLVPLNNYQYYGNGTVGDYEWAVLGSAPNRQLVVQAKNIQANYYYYSTVQGNWQTVVYEAGISSFQFNYGKELGTFGGGIYGSYYDWGECYNGGNYAYGGMTGIKAGGNQSLLIGWYGSGNGLNDAAWPANTLGTGTNPKFAYNWTGGGSRYYLDNNNVKQTDNNNYVFCNGWTHLPTTSYRAFIAWPYDFSCDAITNPSNEALLSKGVQFTPTVQISNQGTQIPTSLQVNLTISFQNGPQAYNQTVTVNNATGPFTSQVISFPPFTPHDTTIGGVQYLAYNIYEDTAIVFNLQPTADQQPLNNTTTDEWICAPPNDIKAVAILSPPTGTSSEDRTPLATQTPISARFRNSGSNPNGETNVPLTAVVRDPSGAVIYRDTVIIPNWPEGALGGNSDGSADFSQDGRGPGKGPYYDTTFGSFTPSVVGTYHICAIAIMANDQLRGDDTVCGPVLVRPENDAAAIAISYPAPDEEVPANTTWQPAALFQSTGVANLFDLPVEVQIFSCSNPTTPVFVADTSMPELNIDNNQVRMFFPSTSSRGEYRTISALPAGCYTICAIVNYLGDGDATNDTACSEFSIIPELSGNIYVGVGRRFQTIHAAVDSMRFRGIGGPLKLILTDANYTENGTYRVSSPNGALDMRGIRHLSATNNVTWEPYPGQHPTITFTGDEPSCFYFGDLFGGYMTFEGYNPLGVPIADKLTAEPNKRGITIVDNETAPGPIMDIEEGASHLTFKDLVLHGSGFFADDSSAVIRIYNDQNRTIFIQGVFDTVPINHIMVNNCELGNAKYGLFDHGLHDMFNQFSGQFIVWRNNSNTFTRNTIGTASNPLSYAGIQFSNEQDLTISHNEITNVDAANAGTEEGQPGATWNVFGIESPSPLTYIGPVTEGGFPVQPGDTGNVVRIWVDANRIHNINSAGGNAFGIAIQQAVTRYSAGSGINLEQSQLPAQTQNRITNNMLFDLQAANGSYPIVLNTAGSEYTTDLDSVFNNSISTNNALANITEQYERHVFIWNNIIQNTGAGPYVNYSLTVPHPFASAISSDYNLFDLRGTSLFDSLTEYDARSGYGTVFQSRYFRNLNDWRSYVGQDMHSLTGDPLFATPAMGTDSLHMPPALTYIESPAYHAGIWLNTSTEARDFDGELRLQGTLTPSIGADEWDGFQFTNDLAVLAITQPAGFSQSSDTALVTMENPLWITAQVKNLSSQNIYNRSVTVTVKQAINGGSWNTIYSSNSAPLSWNEGETQAVVFQGPRLNPATVAGSVYMVTVTVPNDQNNANNTQSKTFRVLLKQNAVLVSYNGATAAGLNNRDSVDIALNRLGVAFDTLDRNAPDGLPNTTDIDYRPWWTLIWVSGDPNIAPAYGQPTGQGGLSFKETQEVEQYLKQGLSYAKKNLVVAGQNIAFYNGFVMPNNSPGQTPVTDSEWLQSYMHTRFVANSPVSGMYNGTIVGQQPAYWKFPDSLNSVSPDVIKPSFTTPLVGSVVTGFAYTYKTHPVTPSDSGAGTTYYDPLVNTVFYGFDWSDPYMTKPGESSFAAGGDTTSGVTRTLAAAFAFFLSHGGTILPVEWVNATASWEGPNALIQWEIAQQKDVVRYDIEQQVASNDGAATDAQAQWVTRGHSNAVDNTTQYAYTDPNLDVTKSYTYRIAAVDNTGAKIYSNTIELGPDATQMGFTLGQNYPNPSTGATEISFTLPEAAHVTLRVMDVTGKVVNSDVTNVSYDAGQQSVKLDLGTLANGSYVYQLIATGADGQTVTLSKKLTLEK